MQIRLYGKKNRNNYSSKNGLHSTPGKNLLKFNCKNLDSYLGPKQFIEDECNKINKIGICNGLAWTMYGGEMISEVTYKDSTFNELPWKFEAGTPPIAEALGLKIAIDYLQKIGMENIEAHERELIKSVPPRSTLNDYVNDVNKITD